MHKILWDQTKDGEDVFIYELQNQNHLKANIMNYGANLLSLSYYTKEKIWRNITLGYDNLTQYFENAPCFGAIVAPNANRIENASFILNQKNYTLEANDGINNLHSGSCGLQKRIWEVSNVTDSSITLTYHKHDMDMGFPGNLFIKVTYTLQKEDAFIIDYEAISDTDTIFNPTFHGYFNLSGDDSGTVLDHMLQLNASHYTYANSASIPTGEIVTVQHTPMDFTKGKTLGQDINKDYPPLIWGHGYDHNYIIDQSKETLSHQYSLDSLAVYHAASLRETKTPLELRVYTDLPGIQIYTGNYFPHSGKIVWWKIIIPTNHKMVLP